MFDYFRNYSSNAHRICCEDRPTKVYMTTASPLAVTCIEGHKCYFLTCNISDNIQAITFKLGMVVDLHMVYVLMVVSMTLTLMQGHSGSVKATFMC